MLILIFIRLRYSRAGDSQHYSNSKTSAAAFYYHPSSSQVACNCKPISFSAAVTGGGSNPVYEWRINGKKTGATTQQFIFSNIYAGDVLTCVYRDDSGCIAGNEVVSNAIIMSTTQTQTITASIIQSTTNICQGMNVGFTVTTNRS